MGERDRQRCLANTCRSAKGDEPASGQVLSHDVDICIPPDDPCRPRGQVDIWNSPCRDGRLGRRPRVLDRRHEAIASSRDIRYVALAVLTITQGTPQLSDVEAKAALVDG